MECLFAITWTVPKFNGIILIFSEEFPKFARNRQCMNLIEVQWWIKDSLSNIDGICDDNDLIDVVQIGSLINTASDSKELSFSGCDIDNMMDCLDDWCYKLKSLVLDKWINLVLGLG